MATRRAVVRVAATWVGPLAVACSVALAPGCDGGPEPKVPTTTTSDAPAATSASAAPAAEPAVSPASTGSAATPDDGLDAGSRESAAELAPPSEIGARHVLVQWMGAERAPSSVVRTKEQARAVAERVRERVQRGESLARLAVEFSDEPGAGARGGSLGVFGKGKMVPAFEQAAFRLKVGEVSEVVESSFGFHVIVRTQ